jgi:hypothetical protein
MDEEKDLKPEIALHPNVSKCRVDFLDKFVKEYAYTRI